MREPLDIDKHIPRPLARDEAAELLRDILVPGQADRVWDEIIAPLYDARAYAQDWQRGRCKRCSAVHPESQVVTTHPERRETFIAHRMVCPKYVGPLEHKTVRLHDGTFATWAGCTCGKSWHAFDEDGKPTPCPDAGVEWRGPRPEGERHA